MCAINTLSLAIWFFVGPFILSLSLLLRPRIQCAVANARGDVINLFARIFNLVLQTFISVCVRVFLSRASFLSVYLSISYGFFALATDLIRFVLFIIYAMSVCVCKFFLCTASMFIVHS